MLLVCVFFSQIPLCPPHWLFLVFVSVFLNAIPPGTSERKARRLYYSDLRERVLRSECRQQEEVYFQLAGYALQADLGDRTLCSEDVAPYFEPKEYFPPWVGVSVCGEHSMTARLKMTFSCALLL